MAETIPGRVYPLAARITALLAFVVLVAACAAAGAPQQQPRPHWTVVALGDSVTAGAACNCSPFPDVYAREVSRQRHVPVTTQNFGTGGQDSGQLRAELQDPTSPETQAVRTANIVVVTIGANDFTDRHDAVTTGSCSGDCLQDELAQMRGNVVAVLRTIHALRRGRPTSVLVTGYWNVFEDGEVARQSFPEPGRQATQELTLRANQAIRAAARATGSTYVDLYRPFNGPASRGDITNLLASDGDHPNARGQRLIAGALVAASLPGLFHS